jgi:hypothetical protein
MFDETAEIWVTMAMSPADSETATQYTTQGVVVEYR